MNDTQVNYLRVIIEANLLMIKARLRIIECLSLCRSGSDFKSEFKCSDFKSEFKYGDIQFKWH